MSWAIEYLPKAEDDLASLDGSVQPRVAKAIQKLALNPLPDYEGGYGKPPGSKRSFNLTGLLKCKLRKDGIRIVYQVVQDEGAMRIVVIGARADDEVYRLATLRREKYGI